MTWYSEIIMASWCALLDIETKAVLTISTHAPAIMSTRESMRDTTHASVVNVPHYLHSRFHREPFFLARANPKTYPEWTWQKRERLFTKTTPTLLKPELYERSNLATAKSGSFRRMILTIGNMRNSVTTGIPLQESVYITKKLQAQRFKDGDYTEHDLMNYAYVVQYADLKGISLQQAADDILLKAKLDDDMLAKTELLRLLYFNKAKEAQTIGELKIILDDFNRDCYASAW